MKRLALTAALALCGGCVAPTAMSDPRHDVRQDLERHELAQRVARLERESAQGKAVVEALKQRDQRIARLEQALAQQSARAKAQGQPPPR